MKYAKAKKPKRNKTILGFMQLVQEIYTSFYRYIEGFGKADRAQGQMGLVH